MTIEVEQDDDGRWLAEVPDIPGVLAYGETREEAIERVHAATLDTYERAVLLASHWQRAGDFLQAARWNERAAGFVRTTASA